MTVWEVFSTFCTAVLLFTLAIYLLPQFVLSFVLAPQDLHAKYGDWALVTGGSSGIGLSIARKLASQGVNVCIAALDDKYLQPAVDALRSSYPNVEIRSVAVNLARDPDEYMKRIQDATLDVPIAIVVNNAGFLMMGFFDERGIEAHMGNLECNTAAGIRIAHMMYTRMIEERRKGCIAFTSSSAWFLPAPYAAMYGATKAALSNFAVSLAIEARNYDVDVCVVQPSYTHTNLYETNPKIGVLDMLSRFGWTGDDVANVLFASVGRVIVRDAGMYSIVTNLVGRAVDAGSLANIIMPFRNSMSPPPKALAARAASSS